jgi:hypothetical protein
LRTSQNRASQTNSINEPTGPKVRSRASPRFVLEIGVGECLPVSVADEATWPPRATPVILEIDIGQRLAVVVAHYWSKRLVPRQSRAG